MSHAITQIDRQQGRRQAWHGLTEVLETIPLESCWLSQWDVYKRPLYRKVGETLVQTNSCEIACSDNPEIVIGNAVDCESYGLISNSDFLNLVKEAISSVDGAVIESVGSVCGRGRIFVSISIPEMQELKAAGRTFLPYLNFFSSHDKTAPFAVNASTVCIVCNNTFNMNLNDAGAKSGGFRVRIAHTKNVQQRIENIPQLIDAYCGTQRRFAALFDQMGNTEIELDKTRAFFTGLLTVPDLDAGNALLAKQATRTELELSTRRGNQIARLTDLFQSGAGNAGRTRADAFSAVTDYYTHESAGGLDSVEKQLNSSEFGSGAKFKARAWAGLNSPRAFETLTAVGELVLANN